MLTPFKVVLRLSLFISLSVTAFAQKPELSVQAGHSDPVHSVAFSPNNKIVASGSRDMTVKLWDSVSGLELRTLRGHSSSVDSVSFSPDGKVLATGSADGTIKLWDVVTGRELKTLRGHTSYVNSVVFSPDGELLLTGGYDNKLKLWDPVTGRELRTIEGTAGAITSVAFSGNGKVLASGSQLNKTGTIKLYNVKNWRELRTLVVRGPFVLSIAFSPDGKTLASSGLGVQLWDVATGRETMKVSGVFRSSVHSLAFSPDGKVLAAGSLEGTIKVWEAATGRELTTLRGHKGSDDSIGYGVSSMSFSYDGKTLASGGGDNAVRLWDVASWHEVRVLSRHSNSVGAVFFSPDGSELVSKSATWGKGGTYKIWDIAGGSLRTVDAHTKSGVFFTISEDRHLIAASSQMETIERLNAQNIREIVTPVTISLLDADTDREIKKLEGTVEDPHVMVFSPDRKKLAATSGGSVKVWDATTGRELFTLEHSPEVVYMSSTGGRTGQKLFRYVTLLKFSPDSRILASGSQNHTLKLWDVSTGRELHSFGVSVPPSTIYTSGVTSAAFSPNGKILATIGAQGGPNEIKLWDVATGSELKVLFGHSTWVSSAAFSPDGRLLVNGSADGSIEIWDVDAGLVKRVLAGPSGAGSPAAFSPNGKILASTTADGAIKLWDVMAGQELITLFAIDDEDWLAVTPDGLFDGSPSAWGKILWRFSQNLEDVAPVEVFFSEFYYPGLLADIIGGRPPRATQDILRKDRRQPQLKVTAAAVEPASSEGVNSRALDLTIEVAEAPPDQGHAYGSGARDVRLFRNGSLVKAWRGDVLRGQNGKARLEARVPLVAGENDFTAYAFNRDNVKSSDAKLIINGAESLRRQGTAYIIAVGINAYANPQYNLRYAVPDAQAFGEELRRQQLNLRRFTDIEVISLLDKEATKSNILLALKRLAGADDALSPGAPEGFRRIKPVEPEDALIIYFSGHGTAQQNQFYLIPHDLGYQGSRTLIDRNSLQMILANSISDRELEQALEQVGAGQILLVIDACNSGQALEAEEKRRGPMNSKGLAQLAYEKGMYVVTAAQSYQVALEVSQLGHGYLTYVLIEEGLKTPKADIAPRDGQVTVREWLDYSTGRVPELQQEKIETAQSPPPNQLKTEARQQPRTKRGNRPSPQKQRQLEQDDAARLELRSQGSREIQRPRVFYRREAEHPPLIMARPNY